jgi:hypothetical protein
VETGWLIPALHGSYHPSLLTLLIWISKQNVYRVRQTEGIRAGRGGFSLFRYTVPYFLPSVHLVCILFSNTDSEKISSII